MPLGLPKSVCGICHERMKTPFEENFCTRPVISTTNRLSCESIATERGLFNCPTPTPRVPMICTAEKMRLESEDVLGVEGEQPVKERAQKRRQPTRET